MKKIYVTAAVIAAMTTAFVSCTNEFENPAGPDMAVVEGQTGRVVFNVNTGKSVSFTRSTISEDQVINKLSLFVFDTSGNIVPGVKQDYVGSDIVDGKLAVSIPSDQMNKTGFKAYLIANQTIEASTVIATETQLLDLIATTLPAEVSTNGIPMASAPISLNTTTAMITAEALMKRVMSSLFVKVNAITSGGTTINSGDFTYKVKKVRTDKGYLLKDGVCTGNITAEAMWAPKANTNAEELLGYMYQSNGFEVEITPSVDKPELGSASRTVVVAADKAKKRNKKYVLNVLPKVSENGTVDFTVTVQDWDATDGNVNVDWADRVDVSSTLPKGIAFQDGGLVAIDPFKIMADFDILGLNYGSVNDLFRLGTGCRIVDVKTEGLLIDNRGLKIKNGLLVSEKWTAPLLESAKGALWVTTEKEGVQAKERVPFTINGALARPKEGFNHRWPGVNAGWYTYAGRIEVQNPQALKNWDARLPVNDVFDVASNCQILDIAANESMTNWETPLLRTDNSDTGARIITGLVNGEARFRLVGDAYGYANFYVQVKHVPSNKIFIRKMTVRIKGK